MNCLLVLLGKCHCKCIGLVRAVGCIFYTGPPFIINYVNFCIFERIHLKPKLFRFLQDTYFRYSEI